MAALLAAALVMAALASSDLGFGRAGMDGGSLTPASGPASAERAGTGDGGSGATRAGLPDGAFRSVLAGFSDGYG